jgi:phosphatidyl-myo-inositol dimannoside synthase
MPESVNGVLLVTRNFPPLRGGMERLNQRMLAGLARRGHAALVGPRGCATHAPPGTPISQVAAAPLWRFLAGALPATWQMARRYRPRVVLAGSGLTAPFAWLGARLVGARSAVYLHGLDLVAPSRLYQLLWLPFIRHCDVAIANSSNTTRLAQVRGVLPGRLRIVHPGTDLPRPDPGARQRFRQVHGLAGRPVLLSVGRLTPRKGLAEFVREALPIILARHPDALLLVIGHDASDALATGRGAISQRQRILETARLAGIEHAVRVLPPCDDATLSEAYRAADVHVFPLREVPGDVEGFGMVAVEAAAHGLPTVAHRAGGVEDAVVDGCSGLLVPAGDAAAFAGAVLAVLASPPSEAQLLAHARRFAWHRFDREIADAIGLAADA